MEGTGHVTNMAIMAAAALIPMVIGFIWYNPAVFGKAWMNASGMTDEKVKGGNMAVIFGLAYLFSFFMAFIITGNVIHVNGFASLMLGIETPEAKEILEKVVTEYGSNFRTFKHGAFHGVLLGLFFVLPVLGTNALFERKGFKYIAINVGYWVVSLALMGGVICQFS